MQISLTHLTYVAFLTSGRHFWLTRPASIFNCPCSLITISEGCLLDRLSQRPRTFQIVISCFPYKHIPNLLLVYMLMLSSDNHTTLLQTIMNITIWKRKKYYYNILRVLMITFIIRLVAILYRLLMAIIMAHFALKLSSYYSN